MSVTYVSVTLKKFRLLFFVDKLHILTLGNIPLRNVRGYKIVRYNKRIDGHGVKESRDHLIRICVCRYTICQLMLRIYLYIYP